MGFFRSVLDTSFSVTGEVERGCQPVSVEDADGQRAGSRVLPLLLKQVVQYLKKGVQKCLAKC